MARKNAELAIAFADISGSTRLYETLGDAKAQRLVADCLELMGEEVSGHEGHVVKTIGDEIMCTFPTADHAVESCIAMQETVHDRLPGRNSDTPADFMVRMGLHYGPCLVEDDDVYGDAVNVAARMAGLAKGGQIVTSRETLEQLSPQLRRSTRTIDKLTVRGKSREMTIIEVLWQADDVTRMADFVIPSAPKRTRLRLSYNSETIDVDQDKGMVILGRGRKADMVINDSMASREHARIECRRGKFILTDMSTNGTYVSSEDGTSYLRREDIVLKGEGKIALGRDPQEATEIVTFACK